MRKLFPLFGAIIGSTLAAAPAMAQVSVGKAPEVNAWPAILVASLLSAVILIGSFKGSKRGHQD